MCSAARVMLALNPNDARKKGMSRTEAVRTRAKLEQEVVSLYLRPGLE
jgi:hypothetical protein